MTPMRRYRSEDATILADIYRRSVHAIGPADYSAAQVEAWASLAPSPERIDTLYTDGRTALVAVDGGDLPVAFGDIEADGHIGMLYCTPEAAAPEWLRRYATRWNWRRAEAGWAASMSRPAKPPGASF